MATKKAVKDDRERTEELLNELAEIGSKAYNEEYRDRISKWEKIGIAIAHTGMFGSECYELANTVAEDWNWHSMVAIVDFFLGNASWEYTIDSLKSSIDGEYTVRGYDGKDHKIKLTLNVEEIEEQY